MTLQLDRFGRQALADFTEQRHGSAGTVVRTASLYYLADRDSGRAAWRVPPFLGARPEAQVGVQVELDDETWDALVREARGQGVDPARLAEHALLYYLGDLDRGRLAERLGGAVREERNLPD